MMSEEQFERLWQRAEAAEHATGLAKEYPTWQRRRRRAAGASVVAAALLAVAVPIATAQRHNDRFDKVYCSQSDRGDQYWADKAARILSMNCEI